MIHAFKLDYVNVFVQQYQMADHGQEMIGSENESHVKTSMEANSDNTNDGSQVFFCFKA